MKRNTTHENKQDFKYKANPLVSVIIPTKNSSKHLKDCLLSIRNQTYKNIEIIVVDNFSSDGTTDIAKTFTKNVYRHGPERAAQVNYGIKQAKGEYVYYTGSDLTMDTDLVEQAVKAIRKEKADAVYLNVLTSIPNPNFWQRARALERRCYFREPGMSAARFWRKEVFQKLGGFDETLGAMADDLEFQTRMDAAGYKTVFIDAKENNPGEYSTFAMVMKRSLYYGWLSRKLILKYPEKMGTQYTFIRKEFMKHTDILLANKYDFFAFVVYKATQYFFAGIGYVAAIVMGYNSRIESYFHKLNYG